jgi:hypothetical protein
MNLSRATAFLRRILGLGHPGPRQHFTRIYEENAFGGTESRSGPGSSLAQTARLRRELPLLLAQLGLGKFLDAPCGDCHWIAGLDWTRTEYTGADVVPALIQANATRLAAQGMKFVLADLCADALPPADLVFCRDCWVHLDFRQIGACLGNFKRSGAAYLLTTTFTSVPENRDLDGFIWRPLNLQLPPFSFPPPVQLLVEGCTEDGGRFADKSLGLWRLKDLTF